MWERTTRDERVKRKIAGKEKGRCAKMTLLRAMEQKQKQSKTECWKDSEDKKENKF